MNLFNEAEQEAVSDAEEPAVKRVDGYYRKKSKTKREELLKDLPIQEILCDIPEEERICPKCKVVLFLSARRQSGRT